MNKAHTCLMILLLAYISFFLGIIIFLFGKGLDLVINFNGCQGAYQSCLQGEGVKNFVQSSFAVFYFVVLIGYLGSINPIVFKMITTCKDIIADNLLLGGCRSEIVNQFLWCFILFNVSLGILFINFLEILNNILK